MNRSAKPEQCADAVGGIIGAVFDELDAWRSELIALGPGARGSEIDDLVERLVIPELVRDEPLLAGAGFVAASESTHGRDIRFSWWLGPSDGTPLAAPTSEPTRFDVTTRSHMEYVRDFGSLEWYAVPASTLGSHITGPYVDHLCTCDYILTFTTPVVLDGQLMGVVGADVLLRRLERELLPLFQDRAHPLTLVNGVGRVIVSTDPTEPVGSLRELATASGVACPGTPFRLIGQPEMVAA